MMPRYKVTDMRYGQRLRTARGSLTQAALAEKSGVSQSLISQLENSDTATGSEYTNRLANALHINPDWLADEIGEMIQKYEIVSDPEEIAAVRLLRQMPAPYRAQAVKQIDLLAELAVQVAGAGNDG